MAHEARAAVHAAVHPDMEVRLDTGRNPTKGRVHRLAAAEVATVGPDMDKDPRSRDTEGRVEVRNPIVARLPVTAALPHAGERLATAREAATARGAVTAAWACRAPNRAWWFKASRRRA